MIKRFVLLYLVPIICCGQSIISEEYELYHNEIYLPGTLSYPNSKEKIPLVVFIHGSGPIDRNGNQGFFLQGNYIKQLADGLNNEDIAFYRYDKRTFHEKNIKKKPSVHIADFAEDANIAIDHFVLDSRFSSIHVLGHSQGSLVAMLLDNKKISSFISLAGAAQTIDRIIIDQVTRKDSLMGLKVREHFVELMDKDTITEVEPTLLTLFAPQNQNFLKDWSSIKPMEEIKKLSLPILIINGDKDFQVTINEAKLLHTANPESKLMIIQNLNHVLKDVNTEEDNLKSYTDPNISISNELVSKLAEFIKSHG